ncbi:MAG: cytidine deaminase [Firmicutes bacterium HGW-Firmicutes-13]|nr:MAG: cytidine deaminase [Firmicutes bacterium HGW-Firmicutes-13]
MDFTFLLEKAREAREFAYAPYSNFAVGAALLTRENKVFTGCNIENAAYSSTICAERVCIFKAVSEGYRDYVALAVYAGPELITPCGECRQVLSEFGQDIKIIMGKGEGYLEKTLGDMLPYSFNAEAVKDKR